MRGRAVSVCGPSHGGGADYLAPLWGCPPRRSWPPWPRSWGECAWLCRPLCGPLPRPAGRLWPIIISSYQSHMSPLARARGSRPPPRRSGRSSCHLRGSVTASAMAPSYADLRHSRQAKLMLHWSRIDRDGAIGSADRTHVHTAPGAAGPYRPALARASAHAHARTRRRTHPERSSGPGRPRTLGAGGSPTDRRSTPSTRGHRSLSDGLSAPRPYPGTTRGVTGRQRGSQGL